MEKTAGYILTQGCGCKACIEIRSIHEVKNGLLWDKMPEKEKFKLFDLHRRYTDPDYGMSQQQIMARDIKKILQILEGKQNG